MGEERKASPVGRCECVIFVSPVPFLGQTPTHRPFCPPLIITANIRVIPDHRCLSIALSKKKGRYIDQCIPRQSALLRLIMSNIFLCPDLGGQKLPGLEVQWGAASLPARSSCCLLLPPTHNGSRSSYFSWCLSHPGSFLPHLLQAQDACGLVPAALLLCLQKHSLKCPPWPQGSASARALSTVKSKHRY